MTQCVPVKGNKMGQDISDHNFIELFECKMHHFPAKPKKKQHLLRCCFGGGRWIRTTEGIASRFTVCPLWPLGNSPIFNCAGAGGRTRTPDLLITNQLLYRLSYTSILTGTALSFVCGS